MPVWHLYERIMQKDIYEKMYKDVVIIDTETWEWQKMLGRRRGSLEVGVLVVRQRLTEGSVKTVLMALEKTGSRW